MTVPLRTNPPWFDHFCRAMPTLFTNLHCLSLKYPDLPLLIPQMGLYNQYILVILWVCIRKETLVFLWKHCPCAWVQVSLKLHVALSLALDQGIIRAIAVKYKVLKLLWNQSNFWSLFSWHLQFPFLLLYYFKLIHKNCTYLWDTMLSFPFVNLSHW